MGHIPPEVVLLTIAGVAVAYLVGQAVTKREREEKERRI